MIAQEHGFHIYDALLISAAIQASCDILYSEDMQDGQVTKGITIRNPFRSAVPASTQP